MDHAYMYPARCIYNCGHSLTCTIHIPHISWSASTPGCTVWVSDCESKCSTEEEVVPHPPHTDPKFTEWNMSHTLGLCMRHSLYEWQKQWKSSCTWLTVKQIHRVIEPAANADLQGLKHKNVLLMESSQMWTWNYVVLEHCSQWGGVA